jgi:hypothetical protein
MAEVRSYDAHDSLHSSFFGCGSIGPSAQDFPESGASCKKLQEGFVSKTCDRLEGVGPEDVIELLQIARMGFSEQRVTSTTVLMTMKVPHVADFQLWKRSLQT